MVVSLKVIEPSDEMPRPAAVAPETYAKYPLIILSQEGKKRSRTSLVTADEKRELCVGLPPGAYTLDVQDRVAKRIRAKPQSFTVVAEQTVHVDMSIFVGLGTSRWRA